MKEHGHKCTVTSQLTRQITPISFYFKKTKEISSMEVDVKNGQENISPPFSTGCCFQVWRPRVLWPVWNDSFLSQDLIGTLILGVGQVVLELWLIENHWFLENSEIWTDLSDWKSCIFGTFFSKCYQIETIHPKLTKPLANDQKFPKFFKKKRIIELSQPSP